jgi:hypothetical protein
MKIKAKYLSILLGLFYCLFILWNRLLRLRNPVDLFTEYTTFRILIYFFLLVLSIILFFYYIKKLFNIQPKLILLKRILEKPLFISLNIIIQEYILNAPKNLYEWFYERIKIRPFIEQCCGFIHEYTFNQKKYFMYILIFFMASFRIVLCFLFLHGVFYLHKLTYFYKGLIFLLIPMCFSILLFSIDHLSKINKVYIESLILFEPNETQDGWIISRKDENDLELTEEIMDYHAEMWFDYLYAIMTIDNYNSLEQKVKSYVNTFCYGFYAIGWGYILYRIYLNEYGLF